MKETTFFFIIEMSWNLKILIEKINRELKNEMNKAIYINYQAGKDCQEKSIEVIIWDI